jgi:hypothetical protein
MRALSIRQPWAHLIIFGGKDVENRTWKTDYRGPLLIHAAKGMTWREYEEACWFSMAECGCEYADLPNYKDLKRGGIIGQVDLVDCVMDSDSRWFGGPWGFVLANSKPVPFHPCKGSLGIFDVEWP